MHAPLDTRRLGLMMTGGSVLSFLALLTVSLQIANVAHLVCPGTPGCTLLGHFPLEAFGGLLLLGGLTALGAYTYIRSVSAPAPVAQKGPARFKVPKGLPAEEKALYDTLARSEGTVFQSELVRSLDLSKVKVSRLLDRLETKGLVERRRRGMANLVVLRQ